MAASWLGHPELGQQEPALTSLQCGRLRHAAGIAAGRDRMFLPPYLASQGAPGFGYNLRMFKYNQR